MPPYLSATQISQAKSCPLAYRLRYVDRLATVEPESDTTARDAGSLVHGVMERLTPAVKPAPEATIHLADGLEVLGELTKERYWGKKAVERAEGILNKVLPYHLPACDERLVEQKWFETFAAINAVGFYDRVDVGVGESKVTIVTDYKTGKHLPAGDSPQVILYLAAAAMKYGRNVMFRGVQLPSRKKVEYQWSTSTLSEAETLIRETMAIRQGPHPANLTYACKWCGYKLLCPSWRGRTLGMVIRGTDTLLSKSTEELQGVYLMARSQAEDAEAIAKVAEGELKSREGRCE